MTTHKWDGTKKRIIIHTGDWFSPREYYRIPYCKTETYGVVTLWKKVTCKKCLKFHKGKK